MRGCDAVEVIRVGLALPVRRQRGTGHRGGAVLVPAAPHAEIDTNAPSARCAAAHFGVLLTTADRAVGSQYPPYASSIALPMAMPLVPLLSHLGAEFGPLLLNAGRAMAGLARPRRTPARWAGVIWFASLHDYWGDNLGSWALLVMLVDAAVTVAPPRRPDTSSVVCWPAAAAYPST